MISRIIYKTQEEETYCVIKTLARGGGEVNSRLLPAAVKKLRCLLCRQLRRHLDRLETIKAMASPSVKKFKVIS